MDGSSQFFFRAGIEFFYGVDGAGSNLEFVAFEFSGGVCYDFSNHWTWSSFGKDGGTGGIEPWRIIFRVSGVRAPLSMSRVGLWALAIFLTGFFTVHFGGFHLGHAVFLGVFFPLDGASLEDVTPLTPVTNFFQIVSLYWPFVVVAAFHEREKFRLILSAKDLGKSGITLMSPYKNVVRMHLLIFVFAFTYFLIPNAYHRVIFVVVFFVYFFPQSAWKRLRGKGDQSKAE